MLARFKKGINQMINNNIPKEARQAQKSLQEEAIKRNMKNFSFSIGEGDRESQGKVFNFIHLVNEDGQTVLTAGYRKASK